ncbi:MAG: STAS domain-containing protein [Alphaproteobacteria bacterium]|nr:STAS domain-containing protein [Alphaproteobacteria bacterium]
MSDCESVTIAINDPMTIAALGPIMQNIYEKFADPGNVVLDLGGVHACDTAGIQLLLAIAKELKARGRALELKEVSPEIRAAAERIGYDISTIEG